MNRIKAIVLIVALLLLSGCAKVEREEPKEVSRFVILEKTSMWRVVADSETGVMYAVSHGYDHAFTVLVDAEGRPLIWRGGKE